MRKKDLNLYSLFDIIPDNMKAVTKLRDRIKEETEQSILAAAEGVFADQGLYGAKMETIASLAGVSVGTLYNYFKDRDSLLNALIDARGDDLVATISAATETEGAFPVQLRRFVSEVFEQFVEHGPFLRILHQGEHTPLHTTTENGESRGLAQRTFRRLRDAARDFLARGIASGELRALDPEMMATMLMGMCKFCMIWQERDHGAITREGIGPHVETVVDFFLEGAAI